MRNEDQFLGAHFVMKKDQKIG